MGSLCLVTEAIGFDRKLKICRITLEIQKQWVDNLQTSNQ